MKRSTQGALAMLFVYILWGILPFYWRALESVNAVEILAHRVVWSCLLTFLLITAGGRTQSVIEPFRSNRRVLGMIALSSVAITANWGIFIWAVNNGRILETSLGYFMIPLISMLFGAVVLKENLTKIQRLAIAIAAAGLFLEVFTLGELPFVSISLAFSFGSYSLLKKLTAIESLVGFTIETLFLTPFALLWLIWLQYSSVAHFPYGVWTTSLLIGTGVVTSVPLVVFAWGVQRSAMTTVGLIQYTAPFLSFLIGVFVYHEPMPATRIISFALTWASIIIFTTESFWRAKHSNV